MNTPLGVTGPRSAARLIWPVLQAVVLALGTTIVALLLLQPRTGLFLLWDVLIPVAPLLLAVAPGVWRNLCPLATFSLAPRQLGLSRALRPDARWQGRLLAGAVLLLLLIVPLRPVILDHDGVITGVVLLVVAALAAGLGTVLDWKGAWCSGLCPVHPVELLYGSNPLASVGNSQCRTCTQCTSPCRDARNGINPLSATRDPSGRAAGWFLIGLFPGFVWGWYQVPERAQALTASYILAAYAWPLLSGAVTLLLFALVYGLVPAARRKALQLWAAAAISTYYWFKLPVMLGLQGNHPLLDLNGVLPAWAVWPARIAPALFFTWLLVLRTGQPGLWAFRPARAATARA